jgi:hypothetical protein
MTAPVITYAALEKVGAPDTQLALFRRLFGDSAIVTEEAAIGVAGRFSWTLAAEHLLSPDARAEFDVDFASAWAAYGEATAAAAADYEAANASALAAYDQRTKSARAAYDAALASAWARAYISDQETKK